MAAEENKEAAPAAAAAGAGGGGGKIVVILTAMNLVITVAVLGVLAYSFSSQKHPAVSDISLEEHASAEAGHGGAAKTAEEQAAEAAKKFGKVIALEQFTVNLSTIGSVTPKFARVNISVQVESGDAEAELGQKMARVRNTIIDLFNSKRPSDLATTEGRNYLKDEIKKALNGFLVSGKVNGVFFTNFALSG